MNEKHLDVVKKMVKLTPLKQLQEKFVPKIRKGKPIVRACHLRGRNYRALTLVEKEAIVIARFGALDNARPTVNSCLAISKKFRIPYSTC